MYIFRLRRPVLEYSWPCWAEDEAPSPIQGRSVGDLDRIKTHTFDRNEEFSHLPLLRYAMLRGHLEILQLVCSNSRIGQPNRRLSGRGDGP